MVIIFEPVEILGKEKAVVEFRHREPHWYMESSQRMGSHPEMGRTLRLLLMGLSNHSCAGVVQMDRVSAFQAEDAGSIPVACCTCFVYSRTNMACSGICRFI